MIFIMEWIFIMEFSLFALQSGRQKKRAIHLVKLQMWAKMNIQLFSPQVACFS